MRYYEYANRDKDLQIKTGRKNKTKATQYKASGSYEYQSSNNKKQPFVK